MNSNGSNFGNGLTKEALLKKVDDEFNFFDQSYFQDRTTAYLRLIYSGTAEKDKIKCLNGDLTYSKILQFIVKKTDQATSDLNVFCQPNWFFNIYLDACFSGTACEAAKEWAKE